MPLSGCTEIADFRLNASPVTISSVVPDEFPGMLDAKLTKAPSSERPPQVRFQYRNTTDRSTSILFNFPAPFSPALINRVDGDAKLWLGPISWDRDYLDDCWTIPEIRYPDDRERLTIPPKKAVWRDSNMYNHADNADCYPAGTYEAEDTIEVEGREFRWRVEINISNE